MSGRRYHTETVTLDYDDGTYSGVLNLDHTAIRTEAVGYTRL